MKRAVVYPRVDSRKEYCRVCVECGCGFKTFSKNRRLCSSCSSRLECEGNNVRVKRFYKLHGRGCVGNVKYLCGGFCGDELQELDLVLSEMRYNGLL